ncbi:MAG: hypothetical protein ACXWCP_20435 [Burkholderiales bacterium]
MVTRYSSRGAMLKVKNGNYVSNAHYDALHEALTLVLQTASDFFRQVAAGQLTASDADATLGLLVNLRGVAFPLSAQPR